MLVAEGRSPLSPEGLGANPWIGTEPRVLASLRDRIDRGAVPPPTDAWWIAPRRAAAQTAGGIEEGYAATYTQPDQTDISVYAVRFVPGVERQDAVRQKVELNTFRVDLDRIAVDVRPNGGACATAVIDHLRSLPGSITRG